jgi:glycosyltransferase involved in cell wall biosynthesis
MPKPIISVVVSVPSVRHCLEATLRALEVQDFEKSAFECIVVDDGFIENSAESTSGNRWDINLSVLRNRRPIGRSMSRNRGWKTAKGEVVAFLDADMIPVPGWLQAYRRTFDSSAQGVVSGATYCLQLNSGEHDLAHALSQLIGTDPSRLFRGDISGQYSCLDSHAFPGWRSTPWRRECELQLRTVCEQHPWSSIRGYSFLGSNFMVSREALEASGGFNPFVCRDALDLGIRLAELGVAFIISDDARAYHLDDSVLRDQEWTNLERQAFLYRNPFRSAFMISLYESINSSETSCMQSLFPRGLVDIAAAELDLSCSAWRALLMRIRPDAIPGCFGYSECEIVSYFSEAAGISEKTVRDYLSEAVTRGLVVRQSPITTYFDIHHTSNWLRTKTLYQEHWLRNASFARKHLASRRFGRYTTDPVSIHCQGQYAIELDLTPSVSWESVTLNMSIPTEHRCQKHLQVTRLYPSYLEGYLDKSNGVVADVPGSLCIDHGGQIGYEFECDVVEELFPGEATGSICKRERGNGTESEHLHFGFPASYLDKSLSLLDHILEGRPADAASDVQRIYHWVLENASYASTPLPDYSILDTGIGTCVQLTRLFANLVRLRGVPVREQCGALMLRNTSRSDIVTIAREYSPFAHTWAEVCLDSWGWVPVELVVMGYGDWQLTASNVTSELRSEMVAHTPELAQYYFGSIDPYRVYTSSYANKVPPIVVQGSVENHCLFQELLVHINHRLTCSISSTELT